jgi:hypothetical protein
VTVFFFAQPARLVSLEISKFDRLISIVVGTEKNSDRGNFPAKSKAEKFNGLAVGARPLDEIFCAYKSARYDALRGSSGSDGGYCGVRQAYYDVAAAIVVDISRMPRSFVVADPGGYWRDIAGK